MVQILLVRSSDANVPVYIFIEAAGPMANVFKSVSTQRFTDSLKLLDAV